MNKKCSLLAEGKRISVSKEVYDCYYQCHERARYLRQRDYKNGCSWQRLEDMGVPVDYHCISGQGKDPLEILILEEKHRALYDALLVLEEGPRWRFLSHVLDGTSERELAKKSGIHRSSIHRELKRSQKILQEELLKTKLFGKEKKDE